MGLRAAHQEEETVCGYSLYFFLLNLTVMPLHISLSAYKFRIQGSAVSSRPILLAAARSHSFPRGRCSPLLFGKRGERTSVSFGGAAPPTQAPQPRARAVAVRGRGQSGVAVGVPLDHSCQPRVTVSASGENNAVLISCPRLLRTQVRERVVIY